MIRTLIVDDDIEMLIGLRHIVDWNDYGFDLVGEAENGLDALEMVKNHDIDLIITDISMPAMDGLEFIGEAKVVNPNVRSIILTCHEEFEYAKRAILLGVVDYIVKYTLTADDLLKSLNKVNEKMHEEKVFRKRLEEAKKAQVANSSPQKTILFRDIIEHNILDIGEINNRAKRYLINIPVSNYYVVGLNMLDMLVDEEAHMLKEVELRKFSMTNVLEEIFDSYKCKEIFWLDDVTQVLLIWDEEVLTELGIEIRRKLKKYTETIYEFIKVQVGACLSGPVESLLDLGQAKDDVMSKKSGHLYTDLGQLIEEKAIYEGFNRETFYLDYQEDLIVALRSGEFGDVDQIIDRMFMRFRHQHFNIGDVWAVINNTFIEFEIQARHHNIALAMLPRKADTLKGYRKLLRQQSESYRVQYNSLVVNKLRSEVRLVVKYMIQHLEEVISCEAMALKVSMSTSYFSRIFKQDTGISFTDYLMKLRIEKASEMLSSSSFTNEEIARQIGIENVTYFYRLYKNKTGKTPGEVRSKRL